MTTRSFWLLFDGLFLLADIAVIALFYAAYSNVPLPHPIATAAPAFLAVLMVTSSIALLALTFGRWR